ncbi:hypothetical protein GE061_019390 [Apolygus lucorum]|uniref:Uncharacterized protein n=1 Tax=Apolygus lucorum TaxID=248454 RepID=A0A8S9X8D6_APOLU|nr:hypothetical protein GE061_019390 [Apolygus lucorum]
MNNNNVLTSNKKLRVRDKGRLVIMLFSLVNVIVNNQRSRRLHLLPRSESLIAAQTSRKGQCWLRLPRSSSSSTELIPSLFFKEEYGKMFKELLICQMKKEEEAIAIKETKSHESLKLERIQETEGVQCIKMHDNIFRYLLVSLTKASTTFWYSAIHVKITRNSGTMAEDGYSR